jgi:hypothetical protein
LLNRPLESERLLTYCEHVLTLEEGQMFIRKAVTLFLELWSEAAPLETECVVDWRWFME